MPWKAQIDKRIHPALNQQKCKGCGTCTRLCRNGVLEVSSVSAKAALANPYNCQEGCRTCARICPAGAITFHDEEAFIAYLHERLDKVRQALANIPEMQPEKEFAKKPNSAKSPDANART